ncbi:XRE family transcriptional regulator [Lactobacillus sp. PFC-70]|nr:helix-turn-helix transcriptional regulator [Levilactobacillus namurensis]MCW3778484.1 helix-turn-helix transcriptional regulator [Levilactobacillus namurensis]MDT7019595.1 helix-turn-helix transcriptional regulator [Levilactobacillus namurensis]PTM21335.1 XRE family transcriptional regulator [Lactobacillus sp. PFC-70]WNN66706.1 helix-turn-helix transcriptional regulator [Levilactobacillus namurensis]
MTLEAARRNAGYSQAEAAKRIGVHYQTLAALEKDSSKIGFSEMNDLSRLYHIPKNNIFFGNRNEFIRLLRSKVN